MSRRKLLGQRKWASFIVIYRQIALWSSCTNLHFSQHGWGRGLVVPHACWHLILLDVAFCQSDGCEIASLWFKLALYSLLVRLNIFSCVHHASLFLTQDQCWFCLKTGSGMMKRKIRETKAKVRDRGETSKDTVEEHANMFSGWGGDWQHGGDAHLWGRPECGKCIPDLFLC